MASLKEQLYDPILRYNLKQNPLPKYDTSTLIGKGQAELASATAAATAGTQATALGLEITTDRPNIKKLLNDLGKTEKGATPKDATQLTDAIIEKWKSDKTGTFLQKLDEDLGKDAGVTAKLTEAIKANPNQIAQNLSKYEPGKLALVIPAARVEPVGPVADSAPAAVAAAPTTKPVQAPKGKASQPASSAPSPAAAAADMGLGSGEEVVTRRQAAANEAAPAPQHLQMSDNLAQSIFEGLADKNDQQIANAVDADMVRGVARSMAKDAVSKYGVNAATAAGFAQKIAGPEDPRGSKAGYDPQLAENIAETWKRNPDFIRQLAKASKDKTEPSDLVKNMARGTITSVMEHPDDLVKDAYVKNLSKKMDMAANPGGGLGKIFSSIFGEGFGASLSGMFSQLFESIKNIFAGFSGSRPVLSMGSKGNSFLPTINVRNYELNQADAKALDRISPNDLRAFPIVGADGKMFHDVVTKNAKGEDVTKQQPNTIAIRDANGKEVKVIPAAGNFRAEQRAGNFGADGRFIEGNYSVLVTTGIDKDGYTNKFQRVEMTPQDFAQYKATVDAAGQKAGGQYQTLAVERYTADDAIKAGKPQGLQIISVNAASGNVGEPKTYSANDSVYAQPQVQAQQAQAQAAELERLRKQDAANNAAFALQSQG